MSTAEDERKLKQGFLRSQIVNGGYDPEEFADYLGSKKDDGSNIDVWTYGELIAEVEEFKKLKEQQYAEGESMLSIADFFGPQGVAEVITTYAAKVEPEQRTEIGSNSKSQCYILKCEKVKTGLFSSAEEYTIQTLPFKYMVKRRYNDFLWLREKLVLDFPGFYIPPVLSKGNQEAFLQNFLNSLMERTELKNAQVLQDFLANQDLKAIYKNIEPKNKSATNLLDQFIGTACQDETSFEKSTKHWLGQQAALEAVNRSEIDSFISGLDKYLEENIPLLSKMKYVSIDIASCFDKMSGLLFQLNQMMDTVLKNQQKLNKQINLNDRYKIDDMILKLKEGINGWGTWCLTNKKLVDDNFVNYLHFRKHELMGLKEVGFPAQPQLVILRSHVVDQHRIQAEQLGAQKTKLFESRKIENWGTPTSQFKQPLEAVLKDYNLASEYILPKEVARVKRLRQITDSLEKGVYFEYVLFNKRDQKRIVKNFGNFSRKMRKNTQADDTIWNIFEKAVVDDSDPSKVVLKKVESNDPGLDNEQRTDDAPIQRLKEKFEDFEVLPDAPHHQAAHLEPDKDGLPLTGSPFLTPQELAAQQANKPEPFVYVEDDKLV